MVTRESWHRRLERARDLSADAASGSLVAFYGALLGAQRDMYDRLGARPDWRPSGDLHVDLPQLHPHLTGVLAAVANAAPEALATEARSLLGEGSARLDQQLLVFWRAPSDRQFFAKAIVQPYAQWLADTGVVPVGRDLPRVGGRCPFCGGTPQLSMFRGPGDGALEGAGRSLQCSTCLTAWPFRRVLCAHCGEDDERRLGYFQSPAFEHVRVEACETCKRYLKGIDLTRLGTAVPLVDEVASAPLDAWADEHGYTKIELNLVGL